MFLYTCFLSLYAKYCFSLEFEEPGELAFVLIYIGHPDKAPQPSESDSISPQLPGAQGASRAGFLWSCGRGSGPGSPLVLVACWQSVVFLGLHFTGLSLPPPLGRC